MIPYPRLPGLSASCFAVRQHRNRWLTRSHQLGRRLRPTLRQSHTLPLLTPAPAASSFCSRQPTHTAPLSASITGQRRYACSWPLAVLVNSLSNDSVYQRQIVANSNEGQKAEVNASEWPAGAYYLTASSPYNLTIFDALVVIARDNAEVGLTVLHGSATSSGKVITVNGIPWYSNVVRIALAYNNN